MSIAPTADPVRTDWLDVAGRRPGLAVGYRGKGGLKPRLTIGAFQGTTMEDVVPGDRDVELIEGASMDAQTYAARAQIEVAGVDIGAWYERGTRHGIRVDKQDGLVRGGEPGVQITWMDAKVDDWVVTPRQGKPVEINALWYSALRVMAQFARRLKRPDEAYDRMVRGDVKYRFVIDMTSLPKP